MTPKRLLLAAVLLAACTVSACGTTRPQKALSPASLGELPATYTGVLPCADCPGIRYTLNLRPDSVFFLRMTYLGEDQSNRLDDVGQWAFSAEDRTLVLRGGREAPVLFEVVRDGSVLRMLDAQGQPIDSDLNYDLTREASYQTFAPHLHLRGMYSYWADVGFFRECLTGLRLPVSQEGDNAALESAYLEARRKPKQKLLVNLEGRLAMRPRMEGDGTHRVLVVDRFIGVWPGETCGAPFATETLENTYWKLVRLRGEPVHVPRGEREPHLRFVSKETRMEGFGGCNQMSGSYERNEEHLTFGQVVSTKKFCQGVMDQERAFFDALEHTARWNISGQHLELYDRAGTLLARFETRYMK